MSAKSRDPEVAVAAHPTVAERHPTVAQTGAVPRRVVGRVRPAATPAATPVATPVAASGRPRLTAPAPAPTSTPLAAPAPVSPGEGRPAPTGRRGPAGPLVGTALGLLLVATGTRAASSVALPAALPPAAPSALAGLGLVLAVLVLACAAPRAERSTRVLLSSAAVAAAGLGLGLLGQQDALVAAGAAPVSRLLGLPAPTTTLLVAGLAPLVVHLAVVVTAARLAVGSPYDVLGGAVVSLVVLVVVGPGAATALVVLASVAGAVLLAVIAVTARPPRGVPAGAPRPSGASRPRQRTDLLPAAGLTVAALGAVVPGVPAPVATALTALAVVAVSERLARWGARGQLEVLARCLAGAVLLGALPGLVLGAAVGAGAGPRAWSGSVVAVALVGLVVAARLPRPPSPAYTRDTHLRVVRGLPWAAAAALLAVTALVLPPPAPGATFGRLVTDDGPLPPRESLSAPSAPSDPPSSPTSSPPSSGSTTVTVGAPAGVPTLRVGPARGTTVPVVVRSETATGPLEVRTRIGVDEVSYPLLSLAAGTEQTVEVQLPERGRFLLTLNDLDSTTPLQTVVVER